MTAESGGRRRHRYAGILRLALSHVRRRAAREFPSRAALAIGIVAVAIALLVVVTGISLGLASQSTVHGSGVDYWIVPESESTLTTVVQQESPQLGDTHATSAEITRQDGVRYATPVLVEVVRMRGEHSDRPEFVLGIGIVPPPGEFEVAGVETRRMTPGDPHFADGAADEPPTGEVVLSPAAAAVLNGSAGDDLSVASPTTGRIDYAPRVTAIGAGDRGPWSDVPVAVFQLSELQALTGAADGDHADQILVRTNDPAVKSALERTYPGASVVARGGVGTRRLADAGLPLAVSLTAFIVGLVVSTLFVATTMGLEVEADRRLIAVLAAIGISGRGRLLFVAGFTLSIAFVGGVAGVLLGWIGIHAANWAGLSLFDVPTVALFHPLLAVYGVGVALLTGVLAAPYPMLLARRTNTLSELTR